MLPVNWASQSHICLIAELLLLSHCYDEAKVVNSDHCAAGTSHSGGGMDTTAQQMVNRPQLRLCLFLLLCIGSTHA